MSLARVVLFDGVTADRAAQLQQQISEGDPPEGLKATELMILSNPSAEQALAIVFFDTEDDYRSGDAILGAMPTDDTPGSRTPVTRYDVLVRRSVT